MFTAPDGFEIGKDFREISTAIREKRSGEENRSSAPSFDWRGRTGAVQKISLDKGAVKRREGEERYTT